MIVAQIPTYTERQNRSLNRIVEMLAAAETRAGTAYKRTRKHPRKEFQGRILVCLPTPGCPEPGEGHPTTFPAWAYNLSQGGVGFVAPMDILSPSIAIGLKQPDGSVRWMMGRIVRRRRILGENFIDYGVAFQRQSGGQPKAGVADDMRSRVGVES
jgi:hypothetical protein